ncbi:MAG: MFS transporter, partial [Actinobacteria bacterium]|nr:MFS transporter [Actinomycetota bacterium]
MTLVFGAHGLLFGTWVSRIPAFQDDLSLGEAELGLALLGATLGGFLALPLSGWIVSRSGSRAMVSGGLAAFALLLVLLPLSPTLPALALALFAFGAAGGALDIAMNAQGLALERG